MQSLFLYRRRRERERERERKTEIKFAKLPPSQVASTAVRIEEDLCRNFRFELPSLVLLLPTKADNAVLYLYSP